MRGFGWGTFIGLLLAAGGIVAPIAWDRYKSASAIEVRELARSLIVSDASSIDKLQFHYDGLEVKSVAKLEFRLSNTGRSSIRAADVVSPPTLTLRDGRILNAWISGVTPEGVEATASVTSDRGSAAIRFPLLNPGDVVGFSLLVSPASASIATTARIAGVRDITLVTESDSRRSLASVLPWNFWVVTVFTGLSWFIAMGGLFLLGKESELGLLADRGVLRAPSVGTPRELAGYFNGAVGPEKKQELPATLQYLASLPQNESLTPNQIQHVNELFLAALRNRGNVLTGLGLFLLLSLVGTWYIVSTLARLATTAG